MAAHGAGRRDAARLRPPGPRAGTLSTVHRVLQVGLGPIGRQMAKRVLERRELELVGGVDVDPELAGRPLGEVLGVPSAAPVVAQIEEAVKRLKPDVALVTTVSDLDK